MNAQYIPGLLQDDSHLKRDCTGFTREANSELAARTRRDDEQVELKRKDERTRKDKWTASSYILPAALDRTKTSLAAAAATVVNTRATDGRPCSQPAIYNYNYYFFVNHSQKGIVKTGRQDFLSTTYKQERATKFQGYALLKSKILPI